MNTVVTLADCQAQDRKDPLADKRDLFSLPEDVIYLDGNSLGALVKSVAPRMQKAIVHEWGHGLIRSWNDANWYPAPLRVGATIAGLIDAQANEVAVCDSTSINLFKVLAAALKLRPNRKVMIVQSGNFPTDIYIAQGLAEFKDIELRCVEPEHMEQAIQAAGSHLALVTLTEVNYKTGQIYDMARITQLTQSVGALAVWDLAHSAGTLPGKLNACNVDFAVGCGYKYLNGGPGAPAFVFAASRHHASMQQPIQGWHGHAQPFAFTQDYTPHAGIDRMLVGTAPQLSLIALEEALTAFEGVNPTELRSKGQALGDLFIALADQELKGYEFGLASPRNREQRGSQVSLTHAQGYAIMQAIIARGVIGDFRAPNILRFGFAALYVRYVDVWNAIATIKDVMQTRAWDSAEFMAKKAVT